MQAKEGWNPGCCWSLLAASKGAEFRTVVIGQVGGGELGDRYSRIVSSKKTVTKGQEGCRKGWGWEEWEWGEMGVNVVMLLHEIL